MWKVFFNPETKEIDVFTEDGHELTTLTDVTLKQLWGDGSPCKRGLVELSFTGVAELIIDKPVPMPIIDPLPYLNNAGK